MGLIINNQFNLWLMSKGGVEQIRETEFFRKNSVSLRDFLT